MSIDQHGHHTGGLVEFDETHAAHIAGEIVDHVGVGQSRPAWLLQTKVQLAIINVVEPLVPLVERLDVNGPQVSETTALKVGDVVAAKESTASAHDNTFIRHLMFRRIVVRHRNPSIVT